MLEELKTVPANEFLLDGEICAFDEEGRSSFQLLQGRINLRNGAAVRQALGQIPAAFMISDLLTCDGYDLRGATWKERQQVLEALLPTSSLLRRVETIRGQGGEFKELVCAKGLEGIVAKDTSSTYLSKRSPHWQKVKCVRQECFVIGGYTRPSGSRRHFGALLLGLFQDRELVFVGRVGTGFDARRLKTIHAKLQKLTRPETPFREIPKELRDAVWVEPKLVCLVQFNEWTRDRILRAPSFQGLQPRVDPRDCRIEEAGLAPSNETSEDELAGYPFLSNLDKPFWPEDGYIKRDLVSYYHRIAPVILPYLRDRPMNLERYPDGYAGKSFYQKDAPDFFPEWIRTEIVQSESKERPVRYVVCDTRDTLVYLANLACIPLHPWSSRVDSLENPDFLIIDLDPDPDVPFTQVTSFALEVRRVLEQLELQSFPKTSGAKGLHVLVPLEARYSYEMVRSFGEIVARLAVHGNEQIATLERSLAKRKGKVYVDYLQNGMGKTIVSAYCLRPRPGAPVSAPLAWSEVGPALRPESFHLGSIFRRLDQKGDLFQGVLTEKQSLENALQKLQGLIEGG